MSIERQLSELVSARELLVSVANDHYDCELATSASLREIANALDPDYGGRLTGTAYGIITAYGTGRKLSFVRSEDVLLPGDFYEGAELIDVFTGVETAIYTQSSAPWDDYRNQIKTVEFVDWIKPASLNYWFYFFTNATHFDIEKLDTSECTGFKGAFQNCTELASIDLSGHNLDKVTTFEYAFNTCSKLETVRFPACSTGVCKSLKYTFANCPKLATLDIKDFRFGVLNYIDNAFRSCSSLTELDLRGVENTSNIGNSASCFYGCSKLRTIYVGAGCSWTGTSVGSGTFSGCTALVGGAGTAFDTGNTGVAYACIDGANGSPGYFTEAGTPAYDETLVGDAYAVAVSVGDGAYELRFIRSESMPAVGDLHEGAAITHVYGGIETSSYANHGSVPWFSIRGSISGVAFVDKVRPLSMAYWFYACSDLVAFSMGQLDTSRVESMRYMFYTCTSLASCNFSGADFGKLENMYCAFYMCSALESLAFAEGESVCENTGYAFYGCSKLTTVDLGAFVTGSVNTVSNMFHNCSRLAEVDLGGLSLASSANAGSMFSGCADLGTIYVAEGTDWSGIASGSSMFYGCASLVGGAGTAFDSSKTNMAYARVDGLGGLPGYFSVRG